MDWTIYTPEDSEDAIARANALYKRRDFLWHLPLVVHLTNHESSHAVVWDERCVCRFLHDVTTPHQDSLLQDMKSLFELRERLASREEFDLRAESIWYRHPTRDMVQTAVAQLYWAVAHALHTRRPMPVTQTGVGVSLIAQNEDYSDWLLPIAVEEFLFVSLQRARGVTPGQMVNLSSVCRYGFSC
jgi:hypothetical protein